jgi:hypothetical protein
VGADEYGTVSAVSGPVSTPAYQVRILGNPVLDELRFDINSLENTTQMAQIIGVDGKIWQQQWLTIPAGRSAGEWPVQHLPSGIYWLRVGAAAVELVK